MEDGGVVLFDISPHKFARGGRGGGGGWVWRCGETSVPMTSLGLVRAILCSSGEKIEVAKGKGKSVNRITYVRKKSRVSV